MYKNEDLSKYCDNIDEPEGKEAVMVDVSNWLQDEKVDVYWKNQSERYRSFNATGTPAPDVIVDTNQTVYAIVVAEASQDSRLVRTAAADLVDIWERMVKESPDYNLNLSEEKPTAVLLATEFSPQGHLFSDSGNQEMPRRDISDGRLKMAEKGFLPSFEYYCTELLSRMTWENAKRRIKAEEPGIGVLLSSRLNEGPEKEVENPDPAALYYTPGRSNVHHWEAIPWYRWK